MTEATMTDPHVSEQTEQEAIKKVSIIISKGSLEGIYPGLIMANGARMEGIEANVFFTFFGMDAIHKKRNQNIKVSICDQPDGEVDGETRYPSDSRISGTHL